MKKLLLWLCLILPFLGIAQEVAPTTFRIDINQFNIPNPDQMQVYLQTSADGWTDILMEDVGGNGIWRKNINIEHPTGENIDVFYRFKITSFGNNGLPYTAWEGGNNTNLGDCAFPAISVGLSGGMVRDVVVPQELIDNGTYVNPTGEYKLTHCWNECDNAPCLPEYGWVDIQLYTDGFPGETSWTMTPPGGSPIIVENDSNMLPNTLYNTIYNDLYGQVVFSLYDSFGDGLGGSQWANSGVDGWFLVKNACQDTLLYVAGDFGELYVDTLTIAACAPPTEGCTDIYALNYDSLAYITNNELCEYPACDGLDTFTADQTCLSNGQTLVQFFWTADQTNANCTPSKFWYSNADNPNPSQYILNTNAQDFAVFAGNGQMPPNWSVEHYGWIEFIDGSFSDTITYTPSSCIAGCTDPTQPTFNPWATFDDGSCSGTTCDQATTYQITMDITFDNWPGETSWSLTSGVYGIIQEELPGTYNFNDIGQTYTYDFCVDQDAGFELIVNDTYGDGLAGSTSGGSMDGMITIYDCEGDTIWNMDNPGFGEILYSGVQFGIECELVESVLGCTDDDYQQFNPLATDDDGSCTDLHVYGCTDPSAFNYDPNASINDIVPDCQYQLWIGDAGGDGWGNSYIGVYQNGVNFGTFTMGPGSYQDSFLLVLDAGIPVNVYYFEVGGPQQPPEEVQFQTWHNSFKLTNADGVVLLHEGTNPFADNGQGALQSFESPFWKTYSSIPYCGDYCIPAVVGCTDPTAFNYNPEANTESNCIPKVLGCTNELAFNYNPEANTDDDSCVPEVIGCTDEEAFNYNEEANVNDEASCIPVILGCMDDGKFNFNPAANTDDGSCIPFVYGCTDINAFNFDVNANTDIGNCIPVILGCTDPEAFNYNVNANTDDESCIPEVLGCTDPTALNFSELANVNIGCVYPVLGCTNPDAFNFDINANVDDGTCVDVVLGCTDPTALNYLEEANTNVGCIYPLLGCTDPNAFNYDPNANVDDNSCVAVVIGCTDPTALNYEELANTNSGCIYPILGCTNPDAFNYDINANTDDGSCVDVVLGCTDPTALNFSESANTNVGCIYPILGCTDPSSFNYDINANTDDGSCVDVVIGCTDATALNYNALANTNNGCIYPVLGCTDVDAFNFDPLANTNDGSCVDFIYGCTDPTQFNYDINANTDNGSCIPYIYGCTDSDAFNYNINANTDNGSCINVVYGCIDESALNYDANANTDDGSCIPFLYGCTDSDALNYNALANTDDGSCIPILLGCTDVDALNYNALANTDDGSCIDVVLGCMDATAFNYSTLANVDDGSCIAIVLGCTDLLAFNYNSNANTDDGSCIPVVLGCIDVTAFNYNPLANTDNGSCVPVVFGCMDEDAFNYDPLANIDNGTCLGIVLGCINPTAINFNPLANTDDGSCINPVYGCTDSTMFNYNPLANTDNGTCIPFAYGCTNANALNYDPLANTDDGSCVLPIYGCTDSTMFNYNPLANVDNGSCLPFVYGCTDPLAYNYNPLANTTDNSCCLIAGCTDPLAVNYNEFACFDDNSCITAVPGCTDVSAYNYNPTANVSDSTACLYDAGCYGGPGVPYWLNDECFAWVIDVDDYCCDNEWDPTCQSMYDYCQLGWPTDIADVASLGIAVYPNPTRNVLTIDTRLDIKVELYDLMGRLLINSTETRRLDLSDLPNGLYNLSIIHENKRYSKQIVKQ
jgi:hypothetical protein